ncbi:MAG: tRNA (adenosine(37)-N6)-threonylcarbamoyltransferase complex dimerization subunit type 1 TsaB [Deltaproteobacteria bacterium]|nr:tRNA (adenosine(37)-N6)-threonylcarbamoyltransferase complex dimerization subunit type 1 TsaB [Deltaproteobacteria bacterium]
MSVRLLLSAYGPPFQMALTCQGQVLASQQGEEEKGLTEVLLPSLQALLDSQKMTPQQLSSIAVVLGPGSFTGLRILLSTVLGLQKAWDLPVYGFNALEALAYPHLKKDIPVWAFLSSVRGEVFGACWEGEVGHYRLVHDPQVFLVREIVQDLKKSATPKKIVGSALVHYPEFLEVPGLQKVAQGEKDFSILSFHHLVEESLSKGLKPLEKIHPLYLSLSQAERRLKNT